MLFTDPVGAIVNIRCAVNKSAAFKLKRRDEAVAESNNFSSPSLWGKASLLVMPVSKVGNRTVQTRTITNTQVTNYTYDTANRLTNAGGVSYTWDNNPTPLCCGDFAGIC
jgi:hypothetical protein